MELSFRPLTMKNWRDFADLFGERGACGGCWCMFMRLTRKEFNAGKGEGNKRAMKRLVEKGEAPGILAYHQGKAIGWCAVAPRSAYTALARSRLFRPLDDAPCWSVVCFFINRRYRRQGVSTALLQAAAAHARARGAEILEGYPKEGNLRREVPAVFTWNGTVSAFRSAGFAEAARPSPTRPLMRLRLR